MKTVLFEFIYGYDFNKRHLRSVTPMSFSQLIKMPKILYDGSWYPKKIYTWL